MANPRNFTTSIPGTQITSYSSMPNVNTQVMTARLYATESATDGKRHKPKGQYIAPTNYSFSREVRQEPRGTYRWGTPPHWTQESPYVSTSVGTLDSYVFVKHSNIPSGFPANLANEALIKARTKVKSGSFNVGVALGESRKTAKHVEQQAQRFRDLYFDLRNSSKWRKMAILNDSVRRIPKLWLELQYAWLPLLSDIYGAAEALDKNPADKPMITVKASARRTYDADGNLFPGTDDRNCSRYKLKVQTGSFVRIDLRPESPGLITMSQLGCLNPLSVAWELVPFSFVVDWFIPIGEFIDQADALAGWKVMGFSQSNFYKRNSSYQGVAGRPASAQINNWTASKEVITLSRSTSGSVPFPVRPRIKDPVTSRHIATALALFQSCFR